MKISKTTVNMADRRGVLVTVRTYNAAELRQIRRKVSSDDQTAVVVEFCDPNSDAAAWYVDNGNALHFASATIGEEWPATIFTEQDIRGLLPAFAEALVA